MSQPVDNSRSTRSRHDPVGILSVLLVLGLFAALVRMSAAPLVNFDTYFHLRFGHEFLDGWQLGRPGTVSTFSTRDWLPTQWASEVGMAKMEDLFGLQGIAVLFCLALLLYAIALYLSCRTYASVSIAAPVTIAGIAASGDGLSARPQLVSFVLVAVVAMAWLRSADDLKPRWWLVPLTWVWVTLHGMWPLGIVIGLVAVAGITLDNPAERRRAAHLVSVPIASAVAAALTPVGPGIYQAVADVGARTAYISEWEPPDFTSPFPFILACILGMTIVARLRSPGDRWVFDALLLLACAMAIYSTRTVPTAAALSAPLLARRLECVVQNRSRLGRLELHTVLVGAAVSLLACSIAVRGRDLEVHHPDALVAQLDRLPTGTVVLNDSGWGAWLMWREPDLDPMLHGYVDLYTDRELARLGTIMQLQPGWRVELTRADPDVALLPPEAPITHALTHIGWAVVQRSDELVLLRAPQR